MNANDYADLMDLVLLPATGEWPGGITQYRAACQVALGEWLAGQAQIAGTCAPDASKD